MGKKLDPQTCDVADRLFASLKRGLPAIGRLSVERPPCPCCGEATNYLLAYDGGERYVVTVTNLKELV